MSVAKKKNNKLGIVVAILSIFIIGFIFGINVVPQSQTYDFREIDERVVSTILPAVDNEGNGVVATLFTTVKPGTGKILVDTSSVLNYIDTQLSGRIAVKAASDYLRINMSNLDVEYAIDVNASLIEGPSAGAAMAVSVLLAMDNATSHSVAITGTINPDGTIGQVGSIFEKAKAAKERGIEIFLVPAGQGSSERSRRIKICNFAGYIQKCKISYNAETVDIGSLLNITVVEVKNLDEAYTIFAANATE